MGKIFPRLTGWLVVSIVMLIGLFFISPVQVDIVFYKVAMICLGAVVGYWADRAMFPYARPDGYLRRHWQLGTDEPEDQADYEIVEGYRLVFIAAMLRRAIVVLAVMIGIAQGL